MALQGKRLVTGSNRPFLQEHHKAPTGILLEYELISNLVRFDGSGRGEWTRTTGLYVLTLTIQP